MQAPARTAVSAMTRPRKTHKGQLSDSPSHQRYSTALNTGVSPSRQVQSNTKRICRGFHFHQGEGYFFTQPCLISALTTNMVRRPLQFRVRRLGAKLSSFLFVVLQCSGFLVFSLPRASHVREPKVTIPKIEYRVELHGDHVFSRSSASTGTGSYDHRQSTSWCRNAQALLFSRLPFSSRSRL